MTTEEAIKLITATISDKNIPIDKQHKSWLLVLTDPDNGLHHYDVTSTFSKRKCPVDAFKRITLLHPDYKLLTVQGFEDRRSAHTAADLLKSHYNKLKAKPDVDKKVAYILQQIDSRPI